jgi:hypothetical protein
VDNEKEEITNELDGIERKMVIAIGTGAVTCARTGFNEQMFLELCKYVWESLQRVGIEEFNNLLKGMMVSDIIDKYTDAMGGVDEKK